MTEHDEALRLARDIASGDRDLSLAGLDAHQMATALLAYHTECEQLRADLRESARYHTDVCGKVEAECERLRKGLEGFRAAFFGLDAVLADDVVEHIDALIGKEES